MGNGSGYCLCALLISNDGLRKADAAQGLALLLKVKSEQSKRVERMEGKSSFSGSASQLGVGHLAIAFGVRAPVV